METKIINGFRSWRGKFSEDRGISFCSKWHSGWNSQLRSHYVADDQKLRGRGGSLSVCITPHVLHLSISLWSHSGYRARWIFAFPCDNNIAVLLLHFFVTKIYDWSIYLFLFVCFSTSSITISCGWPKRISEFVPHSSSKWQRNSPILIYKGIFILGRVCWAGLGPEGLTVAFSSLRGALKKRPCSALWCQPFPCQPSQNWPPLGCIQSLWLRHHERGK